MAKYTITIKSLIDNNFNFGLTSYPIFDENYRSILNDKILKHYYFNEIGQETAEMFKFMLNQKMNEIMDYYNTLYTEKINLFNRLTDNVNLTESFNRDTSTETTSNSTSQNNGKNLFQDTPQGKIWQDDIDEVNYATNVNMARNNIEDNSTANGTGEESYLKTIVGNNGNKYSFEVLKDLKDSLINIDMLIINDLSDLFMGIF